MAPDLSDKAKKRMMDKVKAIRSQIDSRYVDDEHRRFCKSSGDETFSRVPEFKTGVVSLEFPRLDGPSYIRSAMALAYPIKWTPRKLEIDTFSHSLLDPVFQAMPGYVKGDMSDLIDMEWYNACLSYLRTLGRLDFIIVMDYTYNGASFTNGNGAMNLQRQREIDIEDEKDGYVKPLSKYVDPLWPAVVRLCERGLNGRPFDKLDAGDLFRKRPDVQELRAALASHLSARAQDKEVETPVGKPLAEELAALSSWEQVVRKITTLDHRFMDILYLLSKWVYKHLDLSFKKNYVLTTYAEELARILREAPPLRREMVVYRGVTNEYYMPRKGTRDVFQNPYPVSVSIDPSVAVKFLYDEYFTASQFDKTRDCCIKVIHVLPGTPALCLWPIGGHEDQKEIVLPPGTNYLIKSHRLRNIVVEVPTFTQGKAVRGEVCWDEMVKRKARNPKFEKMFPRKWVTEIYVDGTAAAIRSRSTRDPQTWRSNASKALKNVPWETLGSTPVSDGNALGLFLANCNVAVKTGVWTPVSRQIRSMKSSGVIGLDAESSLLTFVDTWFKPVGQPGLSAREQMRSLVEKISSIVPLPSHK
eukprot:jgi/Mesvir1/2616/Mv05575-RA.1